MCLRGHISERYASGACKTCVREASKARHIKHRAEILAYKKAHWAENAQNHSDARRKLRDERGDDVRAKERAYRSKNKDAVNATVRARYKKNPAPFLKRDMDNLAGKLNRTPNWLTTEHHAEILEFYKESSRLAKETGIPHDVDHIQPLRGKTSSGLHVPWNLQVLTASENRSKGNRV